MNRKKLLHSITLIVTVLVLCVFGLVFLIIFDNYKEARGTDRQNISYGEYTKYIDIHDIVKEAYVTNKGYTNELPKYMTEDVFKHINYKSYRVDDSEYTRPLKVDCDLKEVYQTKDKDNNLIYVDMIYSLLITDATGKMIGGADKVPVTYTVIIDENRWYIIDKFEKP